MKKTGKYPDIRFNELFNLNFKFKSIKEKYEKEKYYLKAHVLCLT